MTIVILLIIVLLFVGLIFINTKINNLKYRAKQQVLKNTGISSSDINAGIAGGLEKKHLQKFLEENPNFTEESIKELLKQYAIQICNKNQINEFSQEVCEKIQKDSKLDKMQNMEFRRVNINSYGKSVLGGVVVFTDNRDEYDVYLTCDVLENEIKVNKYQILKGVAVGL